MILDDEQCIARLATSLINAADIQRIENLLRKLSNSNLNRLIWNGQSLIHLCCLYNRLDALELFVEYGQCDVHQLNNDGWLPLHIAVYLGHTHIVQYLIQFRPTSSIRTVKRMRSIEIGQPLLTDL